MNQRINGTTTLRALFTMAIMTTFGGIPNISLSPPARTEQAVISLSPSRDNTLYENATGVISNGAGSFFFAGRTNNGLNRRGVIAFDIAGNIPAGSTIDSVTLSLHMSQTLPGNQNVSLHRLLANWGEGSSNAVMEEGQGAPAATGDATWLHTFFNTSLWTAAGGDFAGSASASASVGAVNFYTWGSTTQMRADVQGWLDNPSSNFGWLVRGNESVLATAKRFDSKENITTANRPALVIDYTPNPGTGDDFWLFLPLTLN